MDRHRSPCRRLLPAALVLLCLGCAGAPAVEAAGLPDALPDLLPTPLVDVGRAALDATLHEMVGVNSDTRPADSLPFWTPAPAAAVAIHAARTGVPTPATVLLTASVVDSAGRGVVGLRRDDFVVREAGRDLPRGETALTLLDRPSEAFVTLLFDSSQHAAALGLWEALAGADARLETFAAGGPTHISVAGFDQGYREFAPFTEGLPAVRAALAELSGAAGLVPGGDLNGALIEAAQRTAEAVRRREELSGGGVLVRGFVLAFVAGADRAGSHPPEAAREALAAGDVTLAAVFPPGSAPPAALSDLPGARFRQPEPGQTPRAAMEGLLDVAATLRAATYALAYCSPRRSELMALQLAVVGGPASPAVPVASAGFLDETGACAGTLLAGPCPPESCGGLLCGGCAPGLACHEGRCGCPDPRFAAPDCVACADPAFLGPDCDTCADPRFAGPGCKRCADPRFAEPDCTACAAGFTGPGCTQCVDPRFTGAACDRCVDPSLAGPQCDRPAIPQTCCPEPPAGPEPPAAGLGVLSVTEVFANPGGADGGAEWFEITVAGDGRSPEWVDVAGIVVTTDPDAPGGPLVELGSAHGCRWLQTGRSYVVAGTASAGLVARPGTGGPGGGECPRLGDGAVVAWLDGLTLRNGGGAIGLWRGDALLASARWEDAPEDRAVQLYDGASVCPSPLPYDPDWTLWGSPGRDNPPCEACACDAGDGGATWGSQPAPGELVVTEVMADLPGRESDAESLEWFEARLAPDAVGPRDLACLQLRTSSTGSLRPLVNPDHGCLRVWPGDWIVFARDAAQERNGGLSADALWDGAGLTNDGGFLGLYRSDGSPLDEVLDWGRSREGRALQLDQALADAAAAAASNDLDDPLEAGEDRWCDAQAPYGYRGDVWGTPGAPNFGCGTCYCQEDDGRWYEAPAPEPGDIWLSEVFANTPGAEDRDQEWVELEYGGTQVRYLNCVALAVDGAQGELLGAGAPTCLSVRPGERIVLAANPDYLTLQGVDCPDGTCIPWDGSALRGSDGAVGLVADGELLDEIRWSSTRDGVAWQRSADGTGWCDAAEDACYADCEGPRPALGTPGEANAVCE